MTCVKHGSTRFADGGLYVHKMSPLNITHITSTFGVSDLAPGDLTSTDISTSTSICNNYINKQTKNIQRTVLAKRASWSPQKG